MKTSVILISNHCLPLDGQDQIERLEFYAFLNSWWIAIERFSGFSVAEKKTYGLTVYLKLHHIKNYPHIYLLLLESSRVFDGIYHLHTLDFGLVGSSRKKCLKIKTPLMGCPFAGQEEEQKSLLYYVVDSIVGKCMEKMANYNPYDIHSSSRSSFCWKNIIVSS